MPARRSCKLPVLDTVKVMLPGSRAISPGAGTVRNSLLAGCLWLATSFPAWSAPNIVLIVVDDVGYSDFGAFGGEIQTPGIDALAASGIRFSNFHAASSCGPTRAMLLTGLDNHVAGIGSMRELMPLSHRGKPGYEGVLNDRARTVATRLQEAGYRTSVAGKWHLGVDAGNLPPARGFDHSFIQADSGSDNYEMRPYLPMQLEARWYEQGERLAELPADFYSSRFFVDKTIEYLQATRAQGGPFFAYIAFQANHTPLQAPRHFIDRYRGEYLQGWARVRDTRVTRLLEMGLLDDSAALAPGFAQERWDALSPEQRYFEARRMQVYAGMATAMDHEIGRFVDYLRESGQYADTVFFILSDNGAVANEPYENEFGRSWLEKHYDREVETLGAPGSWVSAGRHWGRVSNTPLQGVKFTAGEGGVRVPLIIAGEPLGGPWQAGASRGRLSHTFVHVTDIAPTLLALAGIGMDMDGGGAAALAGKSLVRLLETGSDELHSADHAIGYEFSGNAALYRGDFKLARNLPPAGDGEWHLFNTKDDPGETTDLRESLSALYQSMQDDYAAYAKRVGVLPMPDNYDLAKQVGVNTLLFVYLPHYLPAALVVLLLLAITFFCWRVVRGLSRAR